LNETAIAVEQSESSRTTENILQINLFKKSVE